MSVPTANSPEPGVAHVSVTLSVAIVSSAVIPIIPLIAITSPGLDAASAARNPASSLTVRVAVAGHIADALVLRDGRVSV